MKYKLQDVAALLGGEIKGDKSLEISGLSPFFQARETELTFAADEKFLRKISETKAGAVIVPPIPGLPGDKTYIVVNGNPRELMPKLLSFFKRKTKPMVKMIEDTAKIGKNVSIAPNVYLGHDVEIGDNVAISPNTTICQGVKIGEGSVIYSNVTIREFSELGKKCIIQPGAVIGSDGFGYVKVAGKNQKIEQIGRVLIGDEVEIGSNTTIDRGAIGDTIIKNYTKIDNLVQIAHNDIIGENCIIISQVGIAGSTEVGDNTTLAGQVGVSGHLKIGSNVIVGSKSAIHGNVKDNQILSGFPLVDHRDDLKIKVSLKKLPEMIKKVKELEKILLKK
ncbi:UDP-3-O-(3-hydroxymyristoyl)glucosamine N-acyltransferase [Ilyobacter polytropus]|uniref:UDP-3-O-acylglucosamine N-acyltransferase n=1 Tax=Ilyobacter polytropus (strain ATCC 51220 / DSM 2926 / LMG 16218 / CuHBu1) TaxID=572544 RepID=E3H6M9_ILYPC|nr:UDP-3-O-(3-hydroxymyristoyl)glucosamine N-acyltransferase [Ilyobacter polytropus]ADO82398.1 UDP-3-O-(3-hydroxymyristoyl) glucosamine N-acyltransferase [Ilyobacter polytropus DSM 2926]